MNKELLIVFVKNIKLGKVKTRLAKTIGDHGAFEVYKELVTVTENATKSISADVQIHFSDAVVETKWKDVYKTVQVGNDLGERMKNAFLKGFAKGYVRIVLIGSDLPDINKHHIENGLNSLKKNDVVFGPAEDGGYYLVGLTKMHNFIFENKPWSEFNLLEETIKELTQKNIKFSTLETLNDIDTFEDLIASNFYKSNLKLQEKIKQLND
ncbi:TIGR04282 family arsenosugar biosynthesis glycosyltransferase [Sabulilitoribacter multivorans]|uniref:TIGR04282 family arsenosugar biosynthesis glycosyltransferase n=1 Tax=Flaviramulus multivorans TaxID=1304750 RepID=A0ABS9IKU3_9FLAO|nr:TIGR04282 family arsenosugar biosynthesis glycosyltransferase [Flaviramulus multivorans]MCF7561220.1 TIGR04282 family arsenosugar biosynthesis glycosyltransferase [Flaviramulus multivorans]